MVSRYLFKRMRGRRQQLLNFDGHYFRESLAILESAIQNDINIISLPLDTIHALQPLDRSVFGPMNTAYNSACSHFLDQNHLNSVNKWSYPGLLAVTWETAVNTTNIPSGFRSCRIYPSNPDAVSPLMLKPSDITLISHDHSARTSNLALLQQLTSPLLLMSFPRVPVFKHSQQIMRL